MTPQQVVGMAVRLFAIWLVVIAFQLYGLARATVYMAPDKTSASMIYGGVVLALILAVVLWLFPMLVAHKIVPRTHHTNTLRMPAREATAAASAILGLWVLIGALPQVMGISGISIVGGGSHAVIAYFSQEPGRLAQALMCQPSQSRVSNRRRSPGAGCGERWIRPKPSLPCHFSPLSSATSPLLS